MLFENCQGRALHLNDSFFWLSAFSLIVSIIIGRSPCKASMHGCSRLGYSPSREPFHSASKSSSLQFVWFFMCRCQCENQLMLPDHNYSTQNDMTLEKTLPWHVATMTPKETRSYLELLHYFTRKTVLVTCLHVSMFGFSWDAQCHAAVMCCVHGLG